MKALAYSLKNILVRVVHVSTGGGGWGVGGFPSKQKSLDRTLLAIDTQCFANLTYM